MKRSFTSLSGIVVGPQTFNLWSCVLILLSLTFCHASTSSAFGQAQVITVGIIGFQDESGANAPPELRHGAARELQQRLNRIYKDTLLARSLIGESNLTLEQLGALGKQHGVKFVVRGGLVALVGNSVQLYADIISVDTGAVTTVRAEGQSGDVGLALSGAVEQLSVSIHRAIVSPAPEAPSPVPLDSPQAPSSGGARKDNDAAETDEELRQLIAQAETIMGNPSAISTETLNSIRKALDRLDASLHGKATLMEQGGNSADADQEIATRRQELQSAVAAATEQASSEEAASAQSRELSGEKKSILASIGEYLGEATNTLQKIQEIRALWRGAREDQSYDPGAQTGNEGLPPIEEPVEEVSGAVTEEGEPVEGVTVTEPESGAAATTDSNGSFVLRVVPGHLTRLVVSKKGKQVAAGQVDVQRGRAAVADFELKPQLVLASQPGPKVMPSTVLVKRNKSGTTGSLAGVVRDTQGRPVARALVSLRGVGLARTDSRGRYAFIGVPAGDHQVIVQKSGLKLQSEQVQVAARANTQSSINLGSSDRNAEQRNRQPLSLRGAGTLLRGVVTDKEKHQPLAGAKITLMLPTGAVSVLTGPNGAYVLRDVKPGGYRVAVTKFGYGPDGDTLVLRSGAAETQDFKLKKSTSPLLASLIKARDARASTDDRPIRGSEPQSTSTEGMRGQLVGRVIDLNSRRPIPDATISLQGRRIAETDITGSFAVTNLPEGTYRIKVNKAGFLEQEKTTKIQPGNARREDFALSPESRGDGRSRSATPELPATGGVRGQVVDAKTGSAVPGASISISGARGVQTSQAGVYAISNLPPGLYQVIVTRSGYADGGSRVTIRPGETVTLSFRLVPRPSIQIRPRLSGR